MSRGITPPTVLRDLLTLTIGVVVTGAVGWTVCGFYDVAAFSLQHPHKPMHLGDVTTFTPDTIGHNAFVCVNGITEHRGLTQKSGRFTAWLPQQMWYFRLLGSRGIFIEVPPDKNLYSPMSRVSVCGRAVDVTRGRLSSRFLQHYYDLFHAEVRSEPARLIEVNVRPGEGRTVCLTLLVALAGFVSVHFIVMAKACKRLLRFVLNS